jgi:hypothetical protein
MDKAETFYQDSLKTILTLIENAQVKVVMASNSQLLITQPAVAQLAEATVTDLENESDGLIREILNLG